METRFICAYDSLTDRYGRFILEPLDRGAGAAVAVVPGSVLNWAAGALFGSVIGVVCVSAGQTIGACLSFLVARYFSREPVEQWLSKKKKLRQLDELVAEHGGVVVALARLVPVIPFNVQNYGFGLTGVPFGTYLFWSWLCTLPGTVLVVVGGAVTVETLVSRQVPWAQMAVLASTVVIMIGLATYAVLKLRTIRATLRAQKDSQSADDERVTPGPP